LFLWHRSVLTAVLTAGAVGMALTALAPEPPRTVGVLAAAHDLVGGQVVQQDDVEIVRLPASAVPDGVVQERESAAGHVLAGPVRRGEPLTDTRFVGPSLLAGFGDGFVATPIRLADPGVLAVLHTGDLVDILAARTPTSTELASTPDGSPGAFSMAPAEVIAAGVRVIALPGLGSGTEGEFADTGSAAAADDGALVLLATTPQAAQRLATAAVTSTLSAIIRPG
jgi:Flp pilus assembly protein CpaB